MESGRKEGKRERYNLRKRTARQRASSSVPPSPRFRDPLPSPSPPSAVVFPSEPRSDLTSDQINTLVVLYLKESGFSHTVFNLEHQPEFKKLSIDESSIHTGALVSILSKGLQYVEMEANMDGSDVDVDGDYVHLEPIDIITKDVCRLKQIVKDKKDKVKELGNHFRKDTEHVQVHRHGNEVTGNPGNVQY